MLITTPNTSFQAPTTNPTANYDVIRTALLLHFKNTVVFPLVHPSALSERHKQRAFNAFCASRVFAFEPALFGSVQDDDTIIGAVAAGYATVIDAALQQQLKALGLTSSIWYRLAGEMEECKRGNNKELRIIENEIMIEIKGH